MNQHHVKCEKRMNQQCSATTKHWTMSDVQNGYLWPYLMACPYPKSPWWIAWSMTVFLSITRCLHLSTHHTGCWQTHSCSMTEVRYVKIPQAWCYGEVRRLTVKQLDGCAYTLCWHTVLLKHKLVLCFRHYKEYEICLWYKIYRTTCVPKIIKTELSLTKLLQK